MKTLLQKINFSLFFFFVFSVVPTFATDYYVDGVNGNNSNTGLSEGSALASIQNAADLTNPGDIVFIKNGTYQDVKGNSKGHATVLTLTRSGSANGGYITYKNFPGHKPKLSAVNCVWGCVEIYASYIKFDGIELVGTNADITYDYAKSVFDEYVAGGRDWNKIGKVNINGLVVNGVDHVYVSNCIIRDFSGGGMAIERDDYVYIENNIVYNNCWYMMYAGSGISLFHSRDIDTNTTDYKNFIRGNTVYNNECLIPWASGTQPYKLSDGNGIIIDNNTNSQIKATPYNGRTLVENNISFNNGGGGVHGYTCANVDIINNTAYNNGSTLGYADIDAQSCTNSRVINNIMYGRTGGNCNGNDANVIYDYNIYFKGSVKKSGSHDKTVDPKFVQLPTITSGKADASTANFRLQSTSPAINNGSNIAGQFTPKDILGVARPVGFSTDMGAYEYPTVIPRTEMNIKQGTTDILDNTGTFDFGDVSSTSPKIVTFTIQNIGDLALNLTGIPKVVVTGTGFSVETDAPATVAANGSATFQVKLTPVAVGVYSGTISIANDDADENPYNFAITGYGYDGTKALQTITFNALPIKVIGGADFNPGATSSLGLPVSYSSSNTGVATIVAGQIHLVNPGTTTITASQPGDAITNPAKNVTQLLTVTPVLPPPGTNMISNPTFDVNTTGWTFANKAGGAATVTSVAQPGYTTNVGNVIITNLGTGSATDNIQLSTNVFVVKDRNYLITFTASADAPRNIRLNFLLNASPWSTIFSRNTIPVTTTATNFGPYFWTSTYTGSISFRFFLGGSAIPVYLDNVQMIEEADVLPIDLLSFNANLTGNNVLLNWATSQEVNAKEFGIEKSTDGRNFSYIGTIAAKNTGNGSHYSFIDYNVSDGHLFYRLKLVDKDGAFKSSKIVSIKKGLIVETGIKVFPNPVASYCLVSYPVAHKNASLSIIRLDGKKVGDYNIVPGSSQRSIDLAGLSNGYYIMVYKNNQQTISSRFIK